MADNRRRAKRFARGARKAAIPLALLLLLPCAAQAQDVAAAQPQSHWITLGTRGGPMPSPTRSQPANALVYGNNVYLVDVGDGAAEQLAKAGVPLAQVRAILLSHLHFDHTAGLLGLLGLRYQTDIFQPLRIYGPPGTRELVAGLVAGMMPAAHAGYGMPGAAFRAPDEGLEVIELRDGASFTLDSIVVAARKNTHYSFLPGSEEDDAYESLSFRFEAPDRTIAYTGDTGPSQAVAELAQGADLLISEMIDLAGTLANIRRVSPDISPATLAPLEAHLGSHHLTPSGVGELARQSGAKAVVVTHLSAPELNGAKAVEYLREIGGEYSGPAVIARDLDRF